MRASFLLIYALTTASLNAGSSHTNTNTRPTTTTETDYTPYPEQLKQAQRDRKVRELQDAYQKFLESEQQHGLKVGQGEDCLDHRSWSN